MGQGQSKRSEGACDRGEGYGAVVPEVMTRSRRGRGGERCGPIEYWNSMISRVVESADTATLSPIPSLSPSLSLPLLLSPSLHFLQPAWFLMVGGDRNFKLALIEKDKEFSDEQREDCEVRGMERSGRQGEGAQSVGTDRGGNEKEGGEGSLPVRWFQPLTLIVCVGVEVSCKQS